jgi:hypothetical protein
MDNETLTSLVKQLMADKEKLSNENDSLKTRLTEATQLADSRETERKELFEENAAITSKLLDAKATMIVKLKSLMGVEGFELSTEDTIAPTVSKFLVNFSTEELLDSEFENALKDLPESFKSKVDQKDTKDASTLVADTTPSVVLVHEPVKLADREDFPTGKTLEVIDRQIDLL